MNQISGDVLRLARIIYGYNSQEAVAEAMEVSVGNVQRWESLENVDTKILGKYTFELHFDMEKVISFIERLRKDRSARILDKCRVF